MYKSKLQELCQQRQWALPRYTSMKDGPDHNPCFKASVFLNGTSFHSSISCKSCKEAQNDAAKSAFLHFGSSSSSPAATPNPAQEVDLGFYKNLLQELTQREEFGLPEYKTMKCGVPHRPTFFSGVEVEGEVFYGKGAKSKKEAEINAAKVAFTNLTERLQVRSSELGLPEYMAGEPLKSMSTSDLAMAVENEEDAEESEVQEVKAGEKVLADSTTSPAKSASCSRFVHASPEEGSSLTRLYCEYHVEVKKLVATFFVSWTNFFPVSGLQGGSSEFYSPDHMAGGPLKSLSSSDLATAIENVEHAEENEVHEVKAGGNVLANATTSPEKSSSCSKSVPVSPKEGSLSSTSTYLDFSALSISYSNMKKNPGLESYLLNNRFRVYPCFPDIAFPKGITVLPISEDKWVAVSLEFPNERDY
ncbi:hypothetical protein CRYUN_Cryun11dG0098800 [Craigia yunnanensis]